MLALAYRYADRDWWERSGRYPLYFVGIQCWLSTASFPKEKKRDRRIIMNEQIRLNEIVGTGTGNYPYHQ